MIRELKVRAAKIWNVDPDAVIWENGMAKPAAPTSAPSSR